MDSSGERDYMTGVGFAALTGCFKIAYMKGGILNQL